MSDRSVVPSRPPAGGPWLRQGARTVCNSVEELDALWAGARFSSTAGDFYANALQLQFGRFRFESALNSAYTCVRDRTLISQHPRPAIRIETILEGQVRRQQQGLRYLQTAGAVAITVVNEPFEFSWQGPGRSVRTVSDLDQLAPQLRRPNSIRAGLVRLTPLVVSYVGFVRNLVEVAEPDAVEQRTLETALFNLHEAVLLEALQASAGTTSLRDRIEDYVHQRLGEPDLSPTTIAAGLQVSLRAVHGAYNVDGVTLAAEIRRQRVLAAARLLQDSSPNVPLWQIAREVGFTSLDRLRRSFTAVLGTNATDYRTQQH